LIVSLSADDLI